LRNFFPQQPPSRPRSEASRDRQIWEFVSASGATTAQGGARLRSEAPKEEDGGGRLGRCVSDLDEAQKLQSERNLSPNETKGFATLVVSR
jgi:hypothetical protein